MKERMDRRQRGTRAAGPVAGRLGLLLLGAGLLGAATAMPGRAQVVVSERAAGTSMRTNVFGLGVAGGPATGLGLSFRHHLPSQFSYQIIGGILKATDRLYYSVGTELQYDLARPPGMRFYAAGGLSYFYAGVGGNNDMKGPARAGLGIGIETGLPSGFNVSADFLFTYFTDGTVLPLPQLGLHYYFF
jgi:hypothetical protein